MSWWDQFARGRHPDNDLSEELQEHIEEKTEQLMRLEHLSRADARKAALVAFGNPSLVEQRSREVWKWRTLDSVLADVRLALLSRFS